MTSNKVVNEQYQGYFALPYFIFFVYTMLKLINKIFIDSKEFFLFLTARCYLSGGRS